MIEFAQIWVFVALVLPILVVLFFPASKAATTALRVPFHESVSGLRSAGPATNRGWRTWLAALAFIALVVAAARPVNISDDVSVPLTGRDIMIAIDISASMAEMDWRSEASRVTRMTVVKKIIGDFISRRQGDRVGVVVFGTNAYLQTPLTFDLRSVVDMLNSTIVGLAGPATAMGDAIGLTIKRLREAEANHRVVILVSDGAANAGWTKPEDAIRVAATEGLKIYTIGVGSKSVEGDPGGPRTGLDEPTLINLASKTGGKYFLAKGGRELEGVYAELDKLEPAVVDEEIARTTTELYPWPLGFALAMTALLILIDFRRTVATPEEFRK